jgi:hypothetical protein
MPHLHLRELKERATHTAQLQTPSKIYSQHVDAPMYLACIAHLISPLTRQHSNTACKHQSDYCTRACERRPPPVHTTTPSSVSACVRMHLPSSVLRAALLPKQPPPLLDQRQARQQEDRCARARLALTTFLESWFGDCWRSFDGSTHRLLALPRLVVIKDRPQFQFRCC